MNVLISGASVAGPVLAYWLDKHGFDVTVVERAPALRDSGYAVDFRGPALEILRDMGILTEIQGLETKMRGTELVDGAGRKVGELPTETFAGDLEVLKRDVTAVLHRITSENIEYVFGDSISAITQDAGEVQVDFDHGSSRTFDFVVGADGVYSNVRRLAFGPHTDFVRHLGMSGAGFTTANRLGLDHRGMLYSAPGRAVYMFSAADAERMTVSLSFGTDSPQVDLLGRDEQEKIVKRAMADEGWEIPHLLEAMTEASDFMFSSACQVDMDRWSTGRVVLVGDAGYCAAPTSGMGTSQALIGAHTLAGYLAGSVHDYGSAFERYEAEVRPYVTENQAHGREAAKMFGG